MSTSVSEHVPPARRWRPLIWGFAAVLLLVPWVAMQFTGEVVWTGLDFLAFGVMLAIACISYEIAARRSGERLYRAAAGVAVITGLLLAWANLAVGIIGNEGNAINLIFFGLLVFTAAGSVVVRFRAGAMAWVLVVTALLQIIGAALAAYLGSAYEGALTLLFCLPWLLSAALFWQAAKRSL